MAITLEDKKILITGVSRPMGIGATLAKRFAEAGANVAVHGYSEYDLTTPHLTAMRDGTNTVTERLNGMGLNVTEITSSDLEVPGNAERIVEEAAERLDGLDGMVLCHTNGEMKEIGDWTPEHIDPVLHVNIRAAMMMIQSFALLKSPVRDRAITLFTSGQYQSPMVKEMAYAVSKEAVICLCRQCARLLSDRGIRVNCVNPGPNDTGYLFGEEYNAVARMFPSGRWGTPDDTADLLLFLHSSYGKWITGQIIASDGGFRENW